MGRDGLEDNRELIETEEVNVEDSEENELEKTLPWSVATNKNSTDLNDNENCCKGIDISAYIKRNPYITSHDVNFKELTIDENITINGAQWRAALIYILPGVSVTCMNGGSLILVRENDKDTEILGAHSQASLKAIDGDIIF